VGLDPATCARIAVLQQIACFGGLKTQTLEFLLSRATLEQVAAGHYFFLENQLGDAVYVLDRGRVEVLKTKQGVRMHLAYLGEGDCFGEMALLAVAPRSASVRAVTDSTAIRITNRNLFELYEHDLAEFAMAIMNLGREVSRRLFITNELLFSYAALARSPAAHPSDDPAQGAVEASAPQVPPGRVQP
jgi:CRP-like cAMP-binding protein